MGKADFRQLPPAEVPGPPGAGRIVLYPKDDGLWYFKRDTDITEYQLSVNAEAIQDVVGAMMVAGPGLDGTYDDGANTYTFEITPATLAIINAALQPGDNISELTNDEGFETPAQLNTRDTNNRNRANHTGSQLASTISDFAAAVRSVVLTGLSLATATPVVATDTILQAIGKLQAQINALVPPIFGTQYQRFYDPNNVSYTTNTPFEAYTFTNAGAPAGTYLIFAWVYLEHGATNANDELTLRVDDNELDPTDGYGVEGKDTGSDIRDPAPFMGEYVHASAGDFDIQIWANQTGGGTSVLHNCQVVVWRVA